MAQWLDPEERVLIEAAQRGERFAFGRLVERYRERAYYAALVLVNNHDDARDLSQDAFIRAYRHLQRFDPSRPFYPWFYRILRNLCINFIRNKARRGRQVPIDPEPEEEGVQIVADGPDPSVVASESEILDRFWAEVAQLSTKLREVILLRHMEDLSYREIAEILEVPIGTVMSRLNAARTLLRERLEDSL